MPDEESHLAGLPLFTPAILLLGGREPWPIFALTYANEPMMSSFLLLKPWWTFVDDFFSKIRVLLW